MTRRVGLATCSQFSDLDADDQLLLPALADLGIEGVPVVWNSPQHWSAFDVVVIRNTWDYTDDRGAFLEWTREVESATALLNPAEIVRWNTDKVYLRDLSEAGVPVVPTDFLDPGMDVAAWSPPAADEYVIKPAVSAGSRDTMRYGSGDEDSAREHIARLLDAERVVMVQPYLAAVDTLGETAMLHFNGEFSHSIRKGPLLVRGREAERVEGLFVQEQIDPRTPSAAERAVADQVLDLVPGGRAQLLYARVDVIPDVDGAPLLLELELSEPSVFLAHDAGAAARFASAIAARL